MKKIFKKALAVLLSASMLISIATSYVSAEDGDNAADPSENVGISDIEFSIGGQTVTPVEDTTPVIRPRSLIPLREVRLALDLTSFSMKQLETVKVSALLDFTYSPYYNDETVDDSFKNEVIVWMRAGGEYTEVTVDTVINLSYGGTIELITGTKQQLNPNNIRYIISVTTEKLDSALEVNLYAQNETGARTFALDEAALFKFDEDFAPLVGRTHDHISSYPTSHTLKLSSDIKTTDNSFYLGFTTTGSESIEIYDGHYNTLAAARASGKEITPSTLNVNLQTADMGLMIDINATTKLTFFVLSDKREAVSYQTSINYAYIPSSIDILPQNSTYSNNVNIYNPKIYAGFSSYLYAYDLNGANKASIKITTPLNGSVLTAKVYEGIYSEDDLNSLNSAKDVTNSILGTGYIAPLNEELKFTIVFYLDGELFGIRNFAVNVRETGDSYASFYIYSLYDADGNYINCDRLLKNEDDYGTYYWTFLVEDETVDLSKVKLDFSLTEGAKLFANSVPQVSKVTEVDFSNGPVQYTTVAPDGETTKNYWVSVVKKKVGSQSLYVYGPETREVYLNKYSKTHDITIANIGDTPLTGLTVTLNSENLKLDPYWTVGGDGNNVLAEYSADSDKNIDGTRVYGKLNNVAKIRLILDGEGAVDGTLTILADGVSAQTIKLQGWAGDPKITTTELLNGTKYVPYSALVQTNVSASSGFETHISGNVYFKEADETKTLTKELVVKPSGEIYGTPTKAGTYVVDVYATFELTSYVYDSSQFFELKKSFELIIAENTDENVEAATDEGYGIVVRVPKTVGKYEDREFKVEGAFAEFMDFWLDGQKLTVNTDYTVEEGSTKIVIRGKTFETHGEGDHTIAAEFRVDGDESKELKRSAQNYKMKLGEKEDNGNNNNNNNNNNNSGNSNNGSFGSGISSQNSTATLYDKTNTAINGSGVVTIAASEQTTLTKNALLKIKESGKAVTFILPSGLKIRIDPKTITDDVREIDLSIKSLVYSNNGVVSGGYDVPANSILLDPVTKGSYGVSLDLFIPADLFKEIGKDPKDMGVYYLPDSGTPNAHDDFAVLSDGGMRVTITGASSYLVAEHFALATDEPAEEVIEEEDFDEESDDFNEDSENSEEEIIEESQESDSTPVDNPVTGVSLAVGTTVIAFALSLVSRKRK